MAEMRTDSAEQARLNAENVAYIASPAVREAYLLFTAEADARGMETSVLASGDAKTLRFYRQLEGRRTYFFSCDRTKTNLRCYIRPQSLRIWPELRQIVLADPSLDAGELHGEIQVFVRTPAESRRLVELLFDRPEFAAERQMRPQAALDLELVADPVATAAAFAEWYECLTGEAENGGDHFLLPAKGIGLRRLRSISDDELRVEFWVGASASAAVQINEPNIPGSENSAGGLAMDGNGVRYIVRQGVLHENRTSGRVEASEFAARTGLVPVNMRVGDQQARRQWHVVTPLDEVSDRAKVFNTADFVARCWRARTWDDTVAADNTRLGELFGRDEREGWFDYVPDPAPRRVLRLQGEVWQALSHQLGLENIVLSKPRHARGYEVDGEVVARGRSLLIEIKSGVTAADFYCGVGQLMLYPALLPRLARHDRILLLPEARASLVLEEALRPLGVDVHRYRINLEPTIQVRFSASFLRVCGMSSVGIAELGAF